MVLVMKLLWRKPQNTQFSPTCWQPFTWPHTCHWQLPFGYRLRFTVDTHCRACLDDLRICSYLDHSYGRVWCIRTGCAVPGVCLCQGRAVAPSAYCTSCPGSDTPNDPTCEYPQSSGDQAQPPAHLIAPSQH